MKKSNLSALALISMASIVSLSACQDEDFGYTTQDVRNSVYARNFENYYGKVSPDQTWDFSSYNLGKLGLVGGPSAGTSLTRALTRGTLSGYENATMPNLYKGAGSTESDDYTISNDNVSNKQLTSVPSGWYEVESGNNSTLDWLDKNLVEKDDNRSKGNAFSFSEPDNAFMIVPIYQGQAGLRWDLHVVDETAKKDYNIWSRSQGLLYEDTSKSNEYWLKPVGGFDNEHTVGRARVIGRPMYISSANITGDFYLYLEVTDGGNDTYATNGTVQSSKKKMMLALSCPRPTNLPDFIQKEIDANRVVLPPAITKDDCKCMIIGCEDANLGGSDWDMNDIVFLVVGFPELPPIHEFIKKRYMIEDLGSTFDWDFNDIVIDVTQEKVYKWTTGTDNKAEKSLQSTKQTAELKHLCGTIPFKVTIGNTVLGSGYTELGEAGKFPGNNDGCSEGGDGYTPKAGDVYFSNGLNLVEIEGWDPDQNNIQVTTWPKEAGQWESYVNNNNNPNGLENTPLTQGSDFSFPENGTRYPYIIACDQDVNWKPEGKNVDKGWFYTKPTDTNNETTGGGEDSGNKVTGTNTFITWNTDYEYKYGTDLWNNYLKISSEDFASASVGDIITISMDPEYEWAKIYFNNVAGDWEFAKNDHLQPYDKTFTYTIENNDVLNELKSNGLRICCESVLLKKVTIEAITKYTLSFGDMTNGSATGAGEYGSGTSVTITATPYSGYHFVKWSDENTQRVRKVTVSEDCTYTAVFAEGNPTYAWSGLIELEGTASSYVQGKASLNVQDSDFSVGDYLVISAYEDAHMEIIMNGDWNNKYSPVYDETNHVYKLQLTQDMVTKLQNNKEITFNCYNTTITQVDLQQTEKYAVTVESSGNGSVSIQSYQGTTANISSGSSVTLEANAYTNYHFVRWTKDDSEVSTSANYTISSFSESLSGTYTAVFEENQKYTVTLGDDISISPTASENSYYAESSITLSVAIPDGKVIKQWTKTVNGNVTVLPGKTNPITVTVDADATYGVEFEDAPEEIIIWEGELEYTGWYGQPSIANNNLNNKDLFIGKSNLNLYFDSEFYSENDNCTIYIGGWGNNSSTFKVNPSSQIVSITLSESQINALTTGDLQIVLSVKSNYGNATLKKITLN